MSDSADTILLVNNCWCLSLCFGQHDVNKVLQNKITSHESRSCVNKELRHSPVKTADVQSSVLHCWY